MADARDAAAPAEDMTRRSGAQHPTTGLWPTLAECLRRAPSPHNTQPTRLRALDGERAELLFVPERGLPAGDPRGRFTYLTFGIVVESMRIAAHAHGCELAADYAGEPLYPPARPGPRKVADLRLAPTATRVDDLDPRLLWARRTNRLPYDERPVPDEVVAELRAEARRHGHELSVSRDPEAIRWVKELNRDALLRDLGHPTYRRELGAWLRYSRREARERRDGLSAAALGLPGWLLKGVMGSHRLFTAPVVGSLTQRAYLRTMRGISTVGWVQGDFADVEDWTAAGRLMLRLWLRLTAHGIDWQPYGSVITSDEARRSMVDRFGMREGEGGRDMVWLLVRMGYARRTPAPSERLPLSEVLR